MASSEGAARALALLLLAGCGGPGLLPDGDPGPVGPAAPDSFHVEFETTAGAFTMAAYRAWSPTGVDRFHDLVRRGYYDDVVIYRVVEGYVAQFGLHDDPDVTDAWRERTIPDEPVVAENTRGRVAFARGGPASRSIQLFVNLGDNSPRLDTLAVAGVVGYPPIGEVIEGMEVVDAFESRYGQEPASLQEQDSIRAHGNAYLDRAFPGLDRIVEARVVRSWR